MRNNHKQAALVAGFALLPAACALSAEPGSSSYFTTIRAL